MSSKILVTGSAGFIGYHLCEALLKHGHQVVGLDNLNEYYDVNLKYSRLGNLGISTESSKIFNSLVESEIHGERMHFIRMHLEEKDTLEKFFQEHHFSHVCHLAAQAGVRYSIENPDVYISSNVNGFFNVLESCRNFDTERFVFASSSSVYGDRDDVPFKEDMNVDKPVSLYAATKKSNELMAHCYSSLYNLDAIGLRFFTVYGPWGRPDMAIHSFTKAILKGEAIDVFNNGNLYRDFTYIDDVVEGVLKVLLKGSDEKKGYKIYNIGNSKPVLLHNLIETIENELGVSAKKLMKAMQPGDVTRTFSDTSNLIKDYNFKSNTDLKDGIKIFVEWFKEFYKV